MLLLRRKIGEKLRLGGDITVTFLAILFRRSLETA